MGNDAWPLPSGMRWAHDERGWHVVYGHRPVVYREPRGDYGLEVRVVVGACRPAELAAALVACLGRNERDRRA